MVTARVYSGDIARQGEDGNGLGGKGRGPITQLAVLVVSPTAQCGREKDGATVVKASRDPGNSGHGGDLDGKTARVVRRVTGRSHSPTPEDSVGDRTTLAFASGEDGCNWNGAGWRGPCPVDA